MGYAEIQDIWLYKIKNFLHFKKGNLSDSDLRDLSHKSVREIILFFCGTCPVSFYLGGFLQVFDVQQSVVDPEDNPIKQSTVERLGHRVSHRTSLSGGRTQNNFA